MKKEEFEKQLRKCDKEALIQIVISEVPIDRWEEIWNLIQMPC